MSAIKPALSDHRAQNLREMDLCEILRAVRDMEAHFRERTAPSYHEDHRRHLSRKELETVFYLTRGVFLLRTKSQANQQATD